MQRHLILDRDGVLNREPESGWVTDPDDWCWEPGALEALVRLREAGVRVSVVTNQSCIGRGVATVADVTRVHRRMRSEALDAGARIDAVFVCVHAPDQACTCRKPLPGLLLDALFAARMPGARVLLIGDAARDLSAGRSAGVPVGLVRTGKGRETEGLPIARSVPVFDRLTEAVDGFLAAR